MTKKVYGHKDFFSQASFIITGLVVLLGLNALFIIWIQYPSLRWWWLAGLLLMGWIFWRMWRIQTKLWYVFDTTGIVIHLPNGKEFLLKHAHIETTERIDRLAWWSGRGVKYFPWNKELHFTTSTSHLLRITMDDGRVVIISPKEYV